ncbi:MAG: hypothetical protein IPN71_04350 [Fibrobacteres bacterium]|nr:hypothetical protein [Fibrobacterota bacterium]
MVKQSQSSNFLRIGVAFRLLGLAALLASPSLAGSPQSIRFDSLPVLGALTPDVSPRVEASSSLPVTLESTDTAVVAIVDGKIRPKKAGWTRVIARQAGDAQFDPAPEVAQLVWVHNRPQLLTLWGRWVAIWKSPARSIELPDSLRRNVLQVSARYGTIAGIRPGGQVFVVSGREILEDIKPFSMPNVAKVRVTFDGKSVVAIRKDGSILDWGAHRAWLPAGDDRPLIPDSVSHGIVDLHLFHGFTSVNYGVALRADGTTFGIDFPSRKVWELPPEVGSGVVEMANAYTMYDSIPTFAFRRADGTLTAWNRRQGLMTRFPDSLRSNIRTVVGGRNYLAVIDGNGKAMEFGPPDRKKWALLPADKLNSEVVSVDVDVEHAVALKKDGSLHIWGNVGMGYPFPDSVVGGSTEVFACGDVGFGVLGKLKPVLSFTAPGKVIWGDGDFEAGLVLQPGRVPVFTSSNPDVAEFREGRILVKHAGTTTLTVSYPADSFWLAAGPISHTLTVAPRRVVVEAKKAQKTFGEADPELAYECARCRPMDSLSGNLGRASGEAAGAYAIQKGTLQARPDLDMVFLSETFSILPRKITVQADSVAKLAGEGDPALTYRVDGLLDPDQLTGSLARDSGEEPGDYPIRLGSLAAGKNYLIDFLGASVRISATSGLGARVKPARRVREIHALVRHPFVDRSMSSQGPRGFVPQTSQVRGEAILDVLMPAAGIVEVAIFDNAGTPVQSWSGEVGLAQWQQLAPSGDGRRRLSMVWDLRSRLGTPVSEGVYLCRILVRTETGETLEQVLRLGVR